MGTSVNWPVGLGGKGNEGVSGLVKQTPNSIGYVELIYAIQNKIVLRLGQEHGREFVKADLESVTAAAAAAAKACRRTSASRSRMRPARASIRSPPSRGSCSPEAQDRNAPKIMVDFMKWALSDGQKFAAELGYAPLPRSRRPRDERAQGNLDLERPERHDMKTRSSRRSAENAVSAWGRGCSPSSSSSWWRGSPGSSPDLAPFHREVRLPLPDRKDLGPGGG